MKAGYYYVRETLILKWRSWLTSHILTRYFAHNAFYQLKIGIKSDDDDDVVIKLDNPDQRICEDVAAFTSRFVDLFLIAFRYTISTLSFMGILWSIAPELVVVLVCYASAGTFLSVRIFGSKLASIAYDTSRKEGNLRHGLVRVQVSTIPLPHPIPSLPLTFIAFANTHATRDIPFSFIFFSLISFSLFLSPFLCAGAHRVHRLLQRRLQGAGGHPSHAWGCARDPQCEGIVELPPGSKSPTHPRTT